MSGQCLSPSETGHALTPATHHRLGRPLPHQQASTTQSAPKVESHLCSTLITNAEIIGYYPQFPVAIPNPRVRHLPVTTPFAAVPPCGVLARLACLIHAANVHSEPGSNPSICILDARSTNLPPAFRPPGIRHRALSNEKSLPLIRWCNLFSQKLRV